MPGPHDAPAAAPRGVAALERLPRWVTGGIVIVLIAAGLVVGGTVGAFLVGLAVFALVGALAATWARTTPAERMFRLAVIVLVTAAVLVRVVPR